MKKIFTLSFTLFLLFGFNVLAQNTVLTSYRNFTMPSKFHTRTTPSHGLNKTSTCAVDTIEYPFMKTSAFQLLNLNASTSATTSYQWYPAPQSITVSGFNFFAFLNPSLGLQNQIVTISIYNAGIDSMPLGAAISSITMNIDTVLGNGSLLAIRKRAMFSFPVTINAGNGYVLAIQNTSANPILIVTNDWTIADGDYEWCASLRLSTGNLRSYNVFVGGQLFNADFLFHPIITYSLNSDFTYTPTCFNPGSPVSFSNTSSAITYSKFYNFNQYNNIVQLGYTWDFGNGVKTNGINVSNTYANAGTYNVSLTDTIAGYYRYCFDTKSYPVYSYPSTPVAGGGGAYCLGSSINLTCALVPGANYYWTGPNGFTSTSQNPVRANASNAMAGSYDVVVINGTCTSAVASVVISIIQQPIAASNSPVCFGQAANFVSSFIAGANYTWTGPNGFTSSVQSPTRTGITSADTGLYTVTVTLTGCSFNSASTRLSGLPVPVAPTVGSGITVCIGENINLTASGNYLNPTYNWNGPNNYTSNSQNPSFVSTGVNNSGTYSVSVTVNGCTSAASTISTVVKAIPSTPTVGSNGALCVGQTLSLSASLIPNATYNWSGPNSFSSTIQNPTKANMTSTDAGLYSLYVSNNGCNSPTVSLNVVVSATAPSPLITSNSPVCAGQSLTLNASNISGATYDWSGPNNFTSTSQNPVINNVTSANGGTYSVTATSTACGTSPASTYTVTILALTVTPVASNSGPVCDGSPCNLFITSVNGASYSWTGPRSFTSSAQNPTINNTPKNGAGIYSVSISTSQCGVVGSYSTEVFVKQSPSITSVSNNPALCAGDTFQISVTGTTAGSNATFNWSGPNSFNAIGKSISINNVSSLNNGTYTITTSDSGCTSNGFNIGLVVKAIPNAPTTSSNAPFCEGGKLDLTASVINNATYVWSGPNNFSSTNRTPSISNATKLNDGTYKVYCIVNGCKSAEENLAITINAKPITPVITNNGPVCERTNVSITTPAVPNATYDWTGPVNFTAKTQNLSLISVIQVQSGIYSCIVTVAGCVSDVGSTNLVINPLPTAPSLSSFPVNKLCSGDSLQLFASFIDVATYSWTGPAGFVSTLRSPTIKNSTLANSGTYAVAINKNGCTSVPATITIAVNPTPNTSSITGLSNVTQHDTGYYSVSGLVGSSFDWNVTGANILQGATTNKIFVKWMTAGNESVKVKETSDQGCVGTEKTFSVNVTPSTGINELNAAANVIIYPNPMDDLLHICMLKNNKLSSVAIYDLIGNTYITTDKSNIDVSHLASGVYLIRVTDNTGNVFSQKLIKN